MRLIKTVLETLFIAIFISALPLGTALAFSGPGAGTTDNPYLIGNCTQLQNMSNDLSASYKIIRNIDCTGTTFTSVGNNSTPFTGTLNGGGYNIEYLTINETGNSLVGLFGYTSGATISDLSVSEAILHGVNQVGTLVGFALNSSISSIRMHNIDLTATGNSVGGMVGELGGSGLSTSDATSDFVSGVSNVGGLVGWAVGGTSLDDSFAQASVTASGNDVGGLIGQVGSGPTEVENTYSTGDLDATGSNVGGLAGLVNSMSSVSDSFTVTDGSSTLNPSTTGAAFGTQSGSLSDLWFDPTDTGYGSCVGSGSSSGCSSSSSDSQFKDNDTNAPVSNWDFTNNWEVNSGGLPELIPLFNFGPIGAPNNNDANGDGTDDSFQPNVNSVDNAYGTWSTIVVPSSSNCDVENPEWATPTAKDSGYSSDFKSMTAFTLDCTSVGATVPVTIIYDKKYDASGWVLRYYNSTTQKYSTVTGAVFGTKTIGGVKKTTVTYDVTDGGAYDSDGTANGVIIDPVVPAISPSLNLGSSAAPNTGDGESGGVNFADFTAILALASFGSGLALYKKSRSHSTNS